MSEKRGRPPEKTEARIRAAVDLVYDCFNNKEKYVRETVYYDGHRTYRCSLHFEILQNTGKQVFVITGRTQLTSGKGGHVCKGITSVALFRLLKENNKLGSEISTKEELNKFVERLAERHLAQWRPSEKDDVCRRAHVRSLRLFNFDPSSKDGPIQLANELINVLNNIENEATDESNVKTPSAGPLQRCSYVPRRLATKFSGRQEELKELRMMLTESQEPIVALRGMAGVGKTELARAFSLQFVDDVGEYPRGVCWIDARYPESIGQQLDQFFMYGCNANAPEEFVDATLRVKWYWERAWANIGDKGLVVFDNVESLADIGPYLPPLDRANHTIITTRLKPIGIRALAVKPLSLPDALKMYRLVCPLRAEDAEKETELLEVLGCLPLAIELVANYQKERGLSCSKLIERIFKAGIRHRAFSSQERTKLWVDAPEGVVQSFELTWKELSPYAQSVAGLLSLLAPAPIPDRLWRQLSPPSAQEEESEDARLELVRWHLIQPFTNACDTVWRVHSLVHLFFSEKLDFMGRPEIVNECMRLLCDVSRALSDSPNFVDSKSFQRRVRPHLEVMMARSLRDASDEKIVLLGLGIAKIDSSFDDLYDIPRLYSSICDRVGSSDGASSPECEKYLMEMGAIAARVAHIQGDFEKTICISNTIRSSKIAGNEDRARAALMMADAYRKMGDQEASDASYNEARSYAEGLRDVTLMFDAIYGAARIRRLKGRLREALDQYKQALGLAVEHGIRKKEAQACFGIAEVSRMLWRVDVAREYYLRSLKIYEQFDATKGCAFAEWGAGEIDRLVALEFFRKTGGCEGRATEAIRHYERSRQKCLVNRDQRSEAWALLGLAEVKRYEGFFAGMLQDKESDEKLEDAMVKNQLAKELVRDKQPVEYAHASLALSCAMRTRRIFVGWEGHVEGDVEVEDGCKEAFDIYSTLNMEYCKVYALVEWGLIDLQNGRQWGRDRLAEAANIAIKNGYEVELKEIREVLETDDLNILHPLNFP